MAYFLDFDRTLFDYESFFPYLAALPQLAALKDRMLVERARRKLSGLSTPERDALWGEIDSLYKSGAFSFTPDSLAQFVFPDAREFLERHGLSTVVITSGGIDLAFQKGKVEASGVEALVSRVVCVTRGIPKGPSVRDLISGYPAPHYFVDDLPEQIDSVIELCPDVGGYEMRRDTTEPSGRYPVIHSLSELL
jgi:hypothetical protein